MPTINDEEFGAVTIRRSSRATQIRVRVAPNGTLRASMPLYAPIFLLKRLIKTSRPELRKMLEQSHSTSTFADGQQVGKSHTLIVKPAQKFSVVRQKQRLVINLPPEKSLDDTDVAQKTREVIIAALRIEAKSYLPHRLAYLARQYGFGYEKVRFSHASSRWGSCSSEGVISLNIALMKLPFEIIDYVLIHELAHTVEMNHSSEFWKLVESADPHFKKHRKLLKNEAPSI